MKKLENEVRNEIFSQMSLTSTLALDVPVRPMEAKGLNTYPLKRVGGCLFHFDTLIPMGC